ncbi:TonB-dependent receptor [Leptolyngbya sp. 15MV]|nr:TonB-dependent receptor [Leptolyngbya sp. 15MV]
MRYVQTRLTSAGLVTTPTGIAPISIDNDYDDWLPAANLQVGLRDDVKLRLAAARVIERPGVAQLATGFVINLSTATASSGTPTLQPFRADQFDVSLEWYTSRTGLISLAGFYKDVSNFVSLRTFTGTIPGVTRFDGGTDFLITAPFNAGGATIKGLEVGVQQGLEFLPGWLSGFGVIANYTLSDVDTDSGEPIARLSRHQVNLIGYYERGGLSARAAYNWRSRFALNGEGGNSVQGIGLYEYIADAAYLDATISYEFNRNLTLVLEGANLLNTREVRFTDIESRLRDLQLNERRFTLGARVRF